MQHRFIRGARKTSYLTELIERHQDYRARSPGRAPQYYQATIRKSGAWDGGSLRSEWDFNTIRTSSAMGSLRSMAKDLMPPGMIPDDDYVIDEGDEHGAYDEDEDGEDSDTAPPPNLTRKTPRAAALVEDEDEVPAVLAVD